MSEEKGKLAEEAKLRGNKALANKKFDDAIAEYTKAIELDAINGVYFSNRCAAYLGAQDPSNLAKALADAETCITTKPEWAKGYARKGSVMCRQRNFKGAIAAYTLASEHSPGGESAEYTQAITEIKTLQLKLASAKTDKMKFGVTLAFQLAVIVLSVLYLIPGVGQPVFFYHALKVSFVLQLLTILRLFGFPKWSKEYGARVVSSPELHFIMPAMVWHASEPSLICLMPMCLRASLALAQGMRFFGVGMLSTQVTQVLAAKTQVHNAVASIEVAIGVLFIILLITPSRNFIAVLLTWQYLRMRYMTSYEMKTAFGALRSKIDSVFYHRFVPGFLKTVYTKTMGYVASFGDIQAAQQAPKCSVM